MILLLKVMQESIERDNQLQKSIDGMTEERRMLAEKYRDELIEMQDRHMQRGGIGKEQLLEFQELRERARTDGVYEEAGYLCRLMEVGS